MKRVLQIIADGNPGGGTTHVLQILTGLDDNFEFLLVTDKDSYLLNESYQLGYSCIGVGFFTSRLDFRITKKLKEIHKQFEPDLVHLHGARACWAYSLARIPTPTIYSVHGYHFLKKSLIGYHASIQVERYIAKKADIVTFESKFDNQIALSNKLIHKDQRFTIINNAIELTTEKECNPEKKSLAFIGRLVPQKDPLLFIEIVSRLSDYQAYMIGGGELEKSVRKMINKKRLSNITLLGLYTHRQVLEELNKFRVLVITSLWEGFPYLPIEAMWRNVPVIASNVGGMDEIIENRVSGILIDSRDPDEFVDAIIELEANPKLRSQIITEGNKRVQTLFSEEKMLWNIKGIYESLLAH